LGWCINRFPVVTVFSCMQRSRITKFSHLVNLLFKENNTVLKDGWTI
jgi:hypothetical protein